MGTTVFFGDLCNGERVFIIRFAIGLLTFVLISYADTTSFLFLNDSIVTNCSRRTGFNCRDLRTVLKSSNTVSKSTVISHYLDSLGFFQQHWDTISRDSIRVALGIRSQIISESFNGIDTAILALFPSITMPYPYDAGRISQRADQLNRLLADNGFPFANITINVKDVPNNQENSSDFSISYVVFTDQICQFGLPYFHGPFSTRKKILQNDFTPRYGQLFNMQKVIDSEMLLKRRPYVKNVIVSAPQIDSSEVNGTQKVSVPLYIEDRSGLGLEGTAGFTASKGVKPALYGNLRMSLVNVFHSGESALFDYAGDKTRQQLKIEFSKPWLFNIPLVLDGAMELEVVQEQYGFLSAQMALFSEIGIWWRIGIGTNVSEATPRSDSTGEHGTFFGADFILARTPELVSRGAFSRELIIKSGSGFSRKAKNYTRTHIDFLAGTHIPLFSWQAVKLQFISKHLITQEKNLIAAEQYRVGGYNSIRGYTDNEFAFRTVIYGQVEYLMYFTQAGAVYIFSDGGIGFEQNVSLDGTYSSMLGYGVGIRLPSKIGTMTMEWARNFQDHKSLGRIHVRFQNELALNSSKILSKF